MPQYPEYKIITATSLEDLEIITQNYIANNWQPLGEIGHINAPSFIFYHEMMRFPQPLETNPELEIEEKFNKKMVDMDQYVKDLLDINGIKLLCQGGKLFTSYGSKVFEGISPNQVIQLIKGSKHCPIDLDETKVVNAIEGII